jgi:hypothetical protein
LGDGTGACDESTVSSQVTSCVHRIHRCDLIPDTLLDFLLADAPLQIKLPVVDMQLGYPHSGLMN